jgi:hypothetical protein
MAVLFLIGQMVEDIGHLILMPFQQSAKLKLVVVMVIYPVLFTTLQFILTDNFIKKNENEKNINIDNYDCESGCEKEPLNMLLTK